MSKKTKKNAWHSQLELADQFENGDIDAAAYWEGVQVPFQLFEAFPVLLSVWFHIYF